MTRNKDLKEALDRFKIFDSIDDLALTREEKLELIASIPLRQAERWERLRFFHNCDVIKKWRTDIYSCSRLSISYAIKRNVWNA